MTNWSVHLSYSLYYTNLSLFANSLTELMVIINTELNLLTDWFCANLLSVNVNKLNIFCLVLKIKYAPLCVSEYQ